MVRLMLPDLSVGVAVGDQRPDPRVLNRWPMSSA
jgi:hypothetical protein